MAKKKKKAVTVPPKLTEAERDLIGHMEHGYQLETDSLGGNPLLRRLKDDEVVRPASANRNTVNALEDRGSRQTPEGDMSPEGKVLPPLAARIHSWFDLAKK